MERYAQVYPDPNNDVEYQRVSQNYNDYAQPKEFRFRVAGIIIYIINIIFEIANGYFLVRAIMKGDAVGGPIFSLLFNLIGILLLGNALFGQKKRRQSFNVYIAVYELFPLVLYSISFLTVSIGFSYFRKLFQDQIEKEHLDMNATEVTILLILFLFIGALYHSFAAWIFNSYKRLRTDRDPDF